MSKKYTIAISVLLALFSFVGCIKDPTDPEETELIALSKYMTKNYPTAVPSKTGLYYIHLKSGIGRKPITGDTLIIHYKGKLISNTEFDNTYKDNTPFRYVVGGSTEVIAGFKEGIMNMYEGDTGILIMPSKLAYGEKRNGPIPAYSSLIFEVYLYDIRPAQ